MEECPQQVRYLNDFEVNWVESRKLVEDLCTLGVNNAEFLPNFKYLEMVDLPKTRKYGPVYRFCTFSRVQELKGIGDAIDVVEELCSEGFYCHLDIYGPVDPGYKMNLTELFQTALMLSIRAVCRQKRAFMQL